MDPAELTVACIGTGLIGRGWAMAFAQAGAHVRLFDPDQTAMRDALRSLVEESDRFGGARGAAERVKRVSAWRTLEEAVLGAQFVQESASENETVKRSLFARLDAACSAEAILGSSASEIPGSRFLSGLPGAARCLIVHPVNPPAVIRLVELCPSPWTSAATVTRCAEVMRAIGKRPVILKREISGFILNRLQLALLGEALHLVAEGYCSAEDVDIVVRDGLGPRWAFMGPFETAHLNARNGLREYLGKFRTSMQRLQADLRVDYPWSEETVNRIHAEIARRIPIDQIAAHQAWRDFNLLTVDRLFGDQNLKSPGEDGRETR